MQTSHEKRSMTADPLLLTPETGAKRTEAEADELQGLPVTAGELLSMLCCGDGSCGDRNCEGHPDNWPEVDHSLRAKVLIALIALIGWCLISFIVFVGYVVGKAFPEL